MVAGELLQAMTRLRARLRAESASTEMAWTWSQLMTLARIVRDGPTTASQLAQAEHVRRQSMAETLSALRAGHLIESRQDPGDGRKALISATREGVALSKAVPEIREAWLSDAFQSMLTPGEMELLLEAGAIMNRIADCELQQMS